MSNKNKENTSNIYSTTSLSDLVSSPVFYSVLVLTILLGLSSAFGFLQNPLRLKAVVDVISKKVSVSSKAATSSVNQKEYVISQGLQEGELERRVVSKMGDRYSIFASNFSVVRMDSSSSFSTQPVSFDYDITSRQFWGDLDISKIESALEESERKDKGSFIIDTPYESLTPNGRDRDASKYSLKAGRVFSL